MNTYDLNGKRAIVTGGAQGIGRAIVERFLDAGAQVTIWDMDRALGQRTCDELEGRGKLSMVDVDVSHWERVRSPEHPAYNTLAVELDPAGARSGRHLLRMVTRGGAVAPSAPRHPHLR